MNNFKLLSLLFLMNITSLYSYSENLEKEMKGIFVCKLESYIIYMQSDDGEYGDEDMSYNLNAINVNTWQIIHIDKDVKMKCSKMSENLLLYAKGNSVILWNSKTNKKNIYYVQKSDNDINGVIYKKSERELLLTKVKYKSNSLCLQIIRGDSVSYCQNIKLNAQEMEGSEPKLGEVGRYFIIQVQYSLYTFDCRLNRLNLLSGNCDGYALNGNRIIYYEPTKDANEINRGYIVNVDGSNKQLCPTKIYEQQDFIASQSLFTVEIDGENTPLLFMSKPYIWENNKWTPIRDYLFYKDKHIIIKRSVKDRNSFISIPY